MPPITIGLAAHGAIHSVAKVLPFSDGGWSLIPFSVRILFRAGS